MSKNSPKTNTKKNKETEVSLEFIEKAMKESYPNMPFHKMNRLMRVFKEMDKSDWLEGEIIMPSDNHLPKDFWKI